MQVLANHHCSTVDPKHMWTFKKYLQMHDQEAFILNIAQEHLLTSIL